MSEQLAIAGPKASDQLATFLGIEKGMMLETLKVQCFKGKRPDEVSDAQLAAFVSTANVLQVNPLIPGMLYAYPERNGGITPILGPDGVFKKLDEFIASGKLTGYECEVKMGADGKPDSATAIIHRTKDQTPAKYTAYYSEWAVTSNPNWQARPRHMIWVRAIKQAARQVIHGLPMDADEYEIAQMQNVTPEAEAPKVERPEPPARKPRTPKGANAVQEAQVVDDRAAQTADPVESAAAATGSGMAPNKTEQLAQKLADPAEAAKAVAVAEGEAPPKQTAAMPKLTLSDGEKFDTTITVEDSAPMAISVNGVPLPSVKAQVTGGYKGVLYHKGGGVLVDNKPALPPLWAKGSTLRVSLSGLLNMKAKKDGVLVPGGVLQVYVNAAEAVAPEANGEEMEA